MLVVEDDVDGQEVVSRILRHHNITFDLAANGEEALNLLARNDYSMAILDLALPTIDGWRLLQKIRETPRTAQLLCVAVTAFHSSEIAVSAIQAGFVAYFPKPIDTTSFVRELERILARSS